MGAYPEFASGMRIDFLGNNQFTYEIFTPGTPSGFWRRRIFWPNIGLALAITPQVKGYINGVIAVLVQSFISRERSRVGLMQPTPGL